ncbi:MAG: caspase family protein, partial [Alphaproteobacteria bacterium]|nr:caspase family protein [Alphaproteobacteria bacterium]
MCEGRAVGRLGAARLAAMLSALLLLGPILRAEAAPSVDVADLYARSYALVIGIDDYAGGWPRLQNAVADAEAIAEAFRARGFDVTLKTDLKGAEMRQALHEFFALK